jgi:hypothetical protein
VYVHVYINTYVGYISLFKFTDKNFYIHIYVNICMYKYTEGTTRSDVYWILYVFIYIHTYMYLCIHIYIYIFKFIYVNIINMYIYIYIYIYVQKEQLDQKYIGYLHLLMTS